VDSKRCKRIFLTGGTGFIGAYAARQFVAEGRQVVLMSRDRRRVPPDLIPHVEIVQGDIKERSLSAHLGGCDAIVHCAKSDEPDPLRRAETDRLGTAHLLDAALAAGVRRFVHLSSISAYGATPDGVVDETFPRVATDDLYSRTKLQLEAAALARAPAIEVVLLQPANVYGAGRCWWAKGLLDLMRRGKVILVNGGTGTANMVHVLDVVQAVQQAVDTPGISGEAFLITDGQPVTWRDYYGSLERIAGCKSTVSLSDREAKALCRELHDASFLARTHRWAGRRFFGRPLIFPLSDEAIDKYCRKTVFSIAKARRRLGYNPRYDLAAGLQTVAAYDHSGD
jgi:nucleoside-diphosphate-sugar epimerase